jgi:saccharopine dehydrogenase (NAD+, L-lysine-forming)
MPMLARLKELGCTLIDYELIRSDDGRRLIFFGRYAGIAGIIDSLWALGQRLRWDGVRSPFEGISPAHTYDGLDEAKTAIAAVGRKIQSAGLPAGTSPLVIGVAGYGNVAKGVQEVLAELPSRDVEPEQLEKLRPRELTHNIVVTTFREQHLVEPREAGRTFDLEDYYNHPDRYRSTFARYLPALSVLVNCNYWDSRYPRLVTKADLRALYGNGRSVRLKVIGDIGCDIEGAIECTVKATDPSSPVYVYEPTSGAVTSGVEGTGPVVLAVDILPAELPRDASQEFSRSLSSFLPALANVDFDVPYEALDLPADLRRAVILHRGNFTAEFARLEAFLEG